jgi:hypothetical protein
VTERDETLEQALRRVLWVLRPYLPDLIVIGGWVPHLYRRYGGFTEWRSRLSGTAEVDVLVVEGSDTSTRQPLAEILGAAGFTSDEQTRGAVWENAPGTGEKVEFFAPHQGTMRTAGKVRSLTGHEGLGAILLTDLELLEVHTREPCVPITIAQSAPEELKVRVPTLGAYLVVKASTFLKRPAGDGETRSRRAKDLVYIRDILAAGEPITRQVQIDIGEIRRMPLGASKLDYAVTQIGVIDRQNLALVEAAAELAERDQLSREAAINDLHGYLTDFREMLEQIN